jgi:hypothetical protein
MTRDLLRDNNRESWTTLSAFVESLSDEQWLEWKNFMRPVLRAAIDVRLCDHFRAGQSVSHLIFSSTEEHGLEVIEPAPLRVTLGRSEASQFFVALSRSNLWFGQPDQVEIINSENAFPVLKAYLSALWTATRPCEPLPACVPPLAGGR